MELEEEGGEMERDGKGWENREGIWNMVFGC